MPLTRTRLVRGAVVAALVGSVIALAAAPPAWAADELELSSDGVHFGARLPGGLFGDIANIVPTDTQAEEFYLRNSGEESGFLRITLRDVVASDAYYARALTLSVTAGNSDGEVVALSDAKPCVVLNEGLRVRPGQVVKVSTLLALADLAGHTGQAASASLAIRVTLSDTKPGTQQPTDCTAGGVAITPPVITPTPTPSDSATPTPTPTPSVIPPDDTPPPASGLLAVAINTWHLFEEYYVLVPVLAFLGGAGLFWLVARRRRKREDDEDLRDKEVPV